MQNLPVARRTSLKQETVWIYLKWTICALVRYFFWDTIAYKTLDVFKITLWSLALSLSLLPVLVLFPTGGLMWWEENKWEKEADCDEREGEQKQKQQKIQIWRQRESDTKIPTKKENQKKNDDGENPKIERWRQREADGLWEQRKSKGKEEQMLRRKYREDEQGGSWCDLHFWTSAPPMQV